MITLTKSGNAIVFTFDDNDHYLNDGTIEVPVNSLTLVTDESQMATFKKSATNDIFISARYDELGMSKADLESWFKENACGSTGGSSSGVTEEWVEEYVSESISGKADTSDVQNVASDVATVSGDVSTLSGAVDSNHNAITAVVGDVQTLSGDVANKADTTAVTASINAAVSGKMDTSAFNTYSASTDARISEDEEVTSAALNELNDALDDKADTSAVTASIAAAVSGKQDTLIAGTNITISGNVISAEGGGGKAIEAGTNISVTTGATADTVNCTLNLENGTNSQSGGIKLKTNGAGNSVSGRDACAFGGGNRADGINSFVTGYYNSGNTSAAFISGLYNKTTNNTEALFGIYALSNGSQTSDLNGNSGCTLFAVGNGNWRTMTNHNAFEIRQNGDIYIADTNDTSTSNWYEKPMIKLQDALGGGGVPESAFTAYTAATDARLAEDEEVTAAALNTLNTATAANTTALGGLKLVQISQADYDLLPVKDPNTLYLITNVVS